MVIKIEGLEHRKGISSKSGNSYDFYVIHYLSEPGANRRVNGRESKNKIVDVSYVDENKFVPGAYYEVVTDLDGNVVKPIVPAKT